MERKRTNLLRCSILLSALIINSACEPQTPTPLPEPPMDISPPPAPTSISAPSAATLPPTEAALAPTTETTEPVPPPPTKEPVTMHIKSIAFDPDGAIPEKYTCFGDNKSPALEWSGVPPEAQSLTLLVYDLDAGANLGASTSLGFAHWILYNIPPGAAGYPEGMPVGEIMEDGAMQGTNDFAQFQKQGAVFPNGAPIKLVGYDGPCPPSGSHRYAISLYALDSPLSLPPGAVLTQVLEAIEGHTLTRADVIGSYTPAQ